MDKVKNNESKYNKLINTLLADENHHCVDSDGYTYVYEKLAKDVNQYADTPIHSFLTNDHAA